MTRLIRRDNTYEQVFYRTEGHFVEVIKRELPKFLPSMAIVDFSPLILGDDGVRRRPDLAIVDRAYRMWAVVEVELESHPLEHHVVPQIRAFVTGRYDDSHAALLHDKDPTLDLGSLINLTNYHTPAIMVIVNSGEVLEAGWDTLSRDYSAELTFVESFRAANDDVIFVVSGYLPAPPPRGAIRLKPAPMINALECRRVDSVPAEVKETVILYSGERPRQWAVIRTADRVVLFPQEPFAVRKDRNYEVLIGDRGRYQLREL